MSNGLAGIEQPDGSGFSAPSPTPWVGLVGNRAAGRGKAGRKVDQLASALEDRGLAFRPVWTLDERRILIQQANTDPACQALVAAGGDGTVAAVIQEQPRVPLAVLPAGTENLFAQHAGLGRNPETIAEAIASPQYALRVNDCSFVLDHLLGLASLKPYFAKPGEGKTGASRPRIGIAGHSYGALTVQSIAGQGQGGKGLLDRRIDAAIAFSPSAMSQERAAAMSQVKIPFFCVTGDLDAYVTFKDGQDSIRLGVPLSQRQWVYGHLPKGKRQELLVAQADHMTFAGEPIDAERFSRDVSVSEQNNPKTWVRISDMTLEFWEFYLTAELNGSPEKRKAYIARMQALADPKDQLNFD